MPSNALVTWQTDASASLDEVVDAHTQLGGTRPGRRALTEINYAYATRLSAHFQGYLRAMHSEAAFEISNSIPNPTLRLAVLKQFTDGRALDRGNPTLGNIGTDFGRFGFKILDAVVTHSAVNASRKKKLSELLEWRNGIAHADLERRRMAGDLVPARMTLQACRTWRTALNNLASAMDVVMADHCTNFGLQRPW